PFDVVRRLAIFNGVNAGRIVNLISPSSDCWRSILAPPSMLYTSPVGVVVASEPGTGQSMAVNGCAINLKKRWIIAPRTLTSPSTFTMLHLSARQHGKNFVGRSIRGR